MFQENLVVGVVRNAVQIRVVRVVRVVRNAVQIRVAWSEMV